jgi:hypothetical protein
VDAGATSRHPASAKQAYPHSHNLGMICAELGQIKHDFAVAKHVQTGLLDLVVHQDYIPDQVATAVIAPTTLQ